MTHPEILQAEATGYGFNNRARGGNFGVGDMVKFADPYTAFGTATFEVVAIRRGTCWLRPEDSEIDDSNHSEDIEDLVLA